MSISPDLTAKGEPMC